VGYGEARPAYSNDTAAERAKNRRIEIIVENP
jgi:flagellar motor protein MotB